MSLYTHLYIYNFYLSIIPKKLWEGKSKRGKLILNDSKYDPNVYISPLKKVNPSKEIHVKIGQC